MNALIRFLVVAGLMTGLLLLLGMLLAVWKFVLYA
jgi:hypothetical protein